MFQATAFSVWGPPFPVDESFKHLHEMCSHIHPLERTGSEVSYLAKFLQPVSVRRHAPLAYPSDHWLIPDKVLGDLVYVRWGTRVLRGPGLASRCNFEGLWRRPCGAVDIGTLGIPWVLGMIQGPPSPERPPIICIIDL